MKLFLIAAGLLASVGCSNAAEYTGEETLKSVAPYQVQYVKDASLKSNQAKVTIKSEQANGSESGSMSIQYGMNGSSKSMVITAKGKSFMTVPGKKVFQFFYTPEYAEITTDSIPVKPGMNTIITVYFEPVKHRVVAEKPVIYLYPEVETAVSVEVNPAGSFTFTYPAYNDSWKITAQPNGDLSANGKTYPYLFWEAAQQLNDPFAAKAGFIVERENTVAFLEKQLAAIGLNAKEQTDFITYWGPRLAAHDKCLLTFVINEACDQFATLNITPKPDRINRVYIVWAAIGDAEATGFTEQLVPVLDRNGFDVLEWGGSEITLHTKTARL